MVAKVAKTNKGAVALWNYLCDNPGVPQWKIGRACKVAQATISRYIDGFLTPQYHARKALSLKPYKIPMAAWDVECELTGGLLERRQAAQARKSAAQRALDQPAPSTT